MPIRLKVLGITPLLKMSNVHRRLQEIRQIEDTRKRGEKLEEFAKEVGCSTFVSYQSSWADKEPVLIERILRMMGLHQQAQVARSACISAFIALISALTAIAAVILSLART